MAKKPQKTTRNKKQQKKGNKPFIGKNANYGGKSGRKHIEVPKDKQKFYESGDHVKVDPIE